MTAILFRSQSGKLKKGIRQWKNFGFVTVA